jgi:hypothetical protein
MFLDIIRFIKPLIRSLKEKNLDDPRNSPITTTMKIDPPPYARSCVALLGKGVKAS